MIPLPPTDPRRVVAYRRVSSAEQAAAFGPDAQRRAIARFAEREGLEIVADIFEDASGTLPLDERPGLREALAAVYQHGAAAVVVARRDRLARDEYAAHDAIRAFGAAGARVLYADGSNGDGDSARLTDSIMHAIAADDRRRIIARLQAGRDAKAAKFPDGRAQGGKVPFGYRRTTDGLAVDPDDAAQVRTIFDLARDGLSQRRIAERVGLPPTTVAGILSRDLYKLERPGRIVDPRVWNAARRISAARDKRTDR